MKWVFRHFRGLLAILMFGVTAIVVGVVMLSSYTSYKAYEKQYYANDLEVRSATAAAPKTIEINDKYKSQYKKTVKAEASEYTTDGKFAVDLELADKSFADIDIYFNYGATDNLLENMNIKVNDSLIEEDSIKLEVEGDATEWHHLIMSNFALPQGELKIQIDGIKNKAMPEIGNVTVFANAALSFAQVA